MAKHHANLSSLRKELLALRQRLETLIQGLLAREPMLPGCVYTIRRRCGKPTCRCTRGELHETVLLSYRGAGRARNVTPRSEAELALFRKLTEPYQRFRRARAELVKVHKEMLRVLGLMERIRVADGERRFRKIRPDVG